MEQRPRQVLLPPVLWAQYGLSTYGLRGVIGGRLNNWYFLGMILSNTVSAYFHNPREISLNWAHCAIACWCGLYTLYCRHFTIFYSTSGYLEASDVHGSVRFLESQIADNSEYSSLLTDTKLQWTATSCDYSEKCCLTDITLSYFTAFIIILFKEM